MNTLPQLERELLDAARRATATSRPRWRRGGAVAAIIALALAGGATATARLAGPLWSQGTPSAPIASPKMTRSVGASQRGLDVLKQPLTAATALPRALQMHLRRTSLAGENPALGRKALSALGLTFWVVPAAGGKICLFFNGGGGGCSRASQIDDGTFSGLMPCAAGGVVHYGMLPNNVTDASLTLADGSSYPITVTNNVWAVQIPRDKPQPQALTWTQGNQSKQAPTGAIPPPPPGSTDLCYQSATSRR